MLRALTIPELMRKFYDRHQKRDLQRMDPLDYYMLRFSVRESVHTAGHELMPAPNGGVMFMGVEFLPY